MNDTITTIEIDTAINLNKGKMVEQIQIQTKSENILKSEDNNIVDLISIFVSVFIFFLGYIFNSVQGKRRDKRLLKKKYFGWKNDLISMYPPIFQQATNIKEYYELLENGEWGLGRQKKMPELFSYHLLNFDKYEFTEALQNIEKIPKLEANTLTTGLFLSIEKIKYYEKSYDQTINFLNTGTISLFNEFNNTLSRLNNEVEKIISVDKVNQKLTKEIKEIYHKFHSEYFAKQESLDLNPFELKKIYFDPLEQILLKYNELSFLYPAYSVLTELTVINIKLRNERLSAIENLKMQFNEIMLVAMTIKSINDKLKQGV